MKKYLFTIIALCIVIIQIQAQSTTVTGKVTDPKGEGIPGATVLEKNTNNGTATNTDGSFSLTLQSANPTLVISAIGFAKQEIVVGAQTKFDIKLATNAEELDEVVVTALGVSKEKATLSYAVQSIKPSDLTDARDNNVINSLSGQIAGAQVTGSSGGVGSSARIILRGYSSLAGNNQPLFVVDGVPYDNSSSNVQGWSNGIDYGNAAADINPDDVASVSVLKGPAATALYGARGGNGVILITTKSGKGKKGIGIDYNFNLGLERPFVTPKFQNQYGQGWNGQFEWVDGRGGGTADWADQSWGPKFDGQPRDQFHGKQQPWVAAPNNFRDFFETGVATTHNVAITSGGLKNHVRVGYTRFDHKGMMPNTDLSRDVVTTKAGFKLTDRLSGSLTATYTATNSGNRPVVGYGSTNGGYSNPANQFIWGGRQIDFAKHLKDNYANPDGTQKNWLTYYSNNPYWILHKNTNSLRRDRINGAATLSYELAKGIKLRGRVMNDFYRETRKQRVAKGSWVPIHEGRIFQQGYFVNEINQEIALVGNTNLSPRLNIDFLAGANRMNSKTESNTNSALALVTANNYSFDNAQGETPVTTFNSELEIQSVFADATFLFDRAISAGFSLRNDWNSTLPSANRSFLYYSARGSVVFSELLSEQLPEWFSFGKILVNYATAGAGGQPYQLDPVFVAETNNFRGVKMFRASNVIPNPDLKNELTTTTEIGADLQFFNRRVGVNVTYYQSQTENQIIYLPVSRTSGYGSALINAGRIDNKGVEVQLTATPFRAKNPGDFQWDIQVNYARNQNSVVALDPRGQIESFQLGSFFGIVVEARPGQPFGSILGRSQRRDDQGRVIVDQNGMPLLTADLGVLGNATPEWTGGISNTFRFKGFDLNFLIDIRHGGDIFSGTNYYGHAAGQFEATGNNREEGFVVPNSVTESGEVNTTKVMPQDYYGNLYGRHDEYVYDGSFIKLRSLTLGYTFPQKWVSSLKLQKLRISFYGRNLWLIKSNIPNVDPETGFSASGVNNIGFEYISTPSARTLGVRLNAKF
ncbi:SusC/RagA family TonB-linked outer membrane protein [uncultured Microscilla sp.]|uniref:SusC/RagA family TonB-linked outer membrane protein n=1 Tax=uncultured Microscilla sp. TaxID=432653 RepID=UPI002613B42A|nr:SusC/RagA family TonB-linked outer membrane protein [uncultured Microscilla sp.]